MSLYAKGLTTGEISAHFPEIYQASVSKEVVSRITDRVIEEMTDWSVRPLDEVYAAVFVDAIVVKVRDGQVANRPSTTRSSNASPTTSAAAPSCRSSIEPSTSNTFPTPSATSPQDESPARRPSSSDPHETPTGRLPERTTMATTTHRWVGRVRDCRWLGCRGGTGE